LRLRTPSRWGHAKSSFSAAPDTDPSTGPFRRAPEDDEPFTAANEKLSPRCSRPAGRAADLLRAIPEVEKRDCPSRIALPSLDIRTATNA
jgi:hypothetical protein